MSRALPETDPLTELLNRRRMEERLDEEAARFRARGTNFSVILADVDRFKTINDEHGHDTGDRVLSRVAGVFEQGVRAGDAVAPAEGRNRVVVLA